MALLHDGELVTFINSALVVVIYLVPAVAVPHVVSVEGVVAVIAVVAVVAVVAVIAGPPPPTDDSKCVKYCVTG